MELVLYPFRPDGKLDTEDDISTVNDLHEERYSLSLRTRIS